MMRVMIMLEKYLLKMLLSKVFRVFRGVKVYKELKVHKLHREQLVNKV